MIEVQKSAVTHEAEIQNNPQNQKYINPGVVECLSVCQCERCVNMAEGLTAVRVGLVEVRRGGRLPRQLRPWPPHRVAPTQRAHTAAVFSVRASL